MITDLKKYFSFILNNEAGRASRKKVIVILILIPVLLLINKLFLIKFVDRNSFQINLTLSNLLFLKGLSPYSKDIISVLENYFTIHRGNVIFQLPIYQLIFYLPFSFIKNLDWALSLWITSNQCIFLICVVKLINIFEWKPNIKLLLIILITSIFGYFAVYNIFQVNTAIIQTCFFIYGLSFLFSDKYIQAGLLLGLATIDPFNFFLPMVIVLSFFISRRQFEPIVWFGISIILLSLVGVIFDSGWFLKYLRNIFLEKSFFPFINYNHALLNWIPKLPSTDLVTFIPIILLVWLFLEFSRLPRQSSRHLFWILSLAVSINPFVVMRETNDASILFLLPFIFLIFLWENHSKGVINKVVYGILGLIMIFLPLAATIFPDSLQFLNNFHTINLIISLVLLILLYWVRWWVMIPYEYLMYH